MQHIAFTKPQARNAHVLSWHHQVLRHHHKLNAYEWNNETCALFLKLSCAVWKPKAKPFHKQVAKTINKVVFLLLLPNYAH